MGSLLSALGIGGNQGPTQISPMAGDPAMPYGTNEAQEAMSEQMPNGWQPHRISFLGALADSFLKSRGGAPVFAKLNEERNMREAMQDFATDPMSAIKRVAQLPGHAEDAWKMYEQYADDKRADLQAQVLREARMDQARGRVASYLGAIQNAKDPAAAYDKLLPNLRNYLKSRGLDEAELPDKYDPDLIGMYQMGGITADQQMDNARDSDYKERRLEQMDQTINNRADYQERRLEQIDSRQSESERHNHQMESFSRDRINNSSNSAANADRIISTKYGPGKIFNKGHNLSIKVGKNEDGSDKHAIYENKGPNQWHLTGYQ